MRRLISALAFFIAARSDDAISVALRLRPHDAGVLFESSCTAAAEIVVTGAPDGDHLLCLSIVEGVLPDPYPELQREGCAVVRRLAGIRPMAVRAHAKVILSQLSGGPSGLLEHRHARSRCLALRTASTVLGCSSREGLRGDKTWDPAPVRDDPNGLASGGKSGVDNAGLLAF